MERIRSGTFEKIDMCFEMTDVGETILQWCPGTVIELVKDKETLSCMDLKIRWNEDEQGNSITTVQRLKESSWNTETHKNGTWRENLRHLENTTDYIFN